VGDKGQARKSTTIISPCDVGFEHVRRATMADAAASFRCSSIWEVCAFRPEHRGRAKRNNFVHSLRPVSENEFNPTIGSRLLISASRQRGLMDGSLLDVRLGELVVAHGVPGAQFAVHHSGETWTWTYGVTRVGSGAAMTDDAPVPLGSVTKTATAAAALVLVADGDLALDEPMAEYLPEARELPAALRDRVTLRHVLNHTGGLPCDPTEARATTARRHVLDCCRTARPLAVPGGVFSYSNIGYLLAGHALTTVTGMSWWEAVDSLLLTPLGLTARFVTGERVPTDLVSGHSVHRRHGTARPVVQSLSPVEAPAGALAASAVDLVRLGRALLEDDDLIGADLRREMTAATPGIEPFGLADGWGLGLACYGPGSTTVGHDGNGDGTSCHLRMNTATGTVVALTANAGSGFTLWRELAPQLPALGIPVGDYDPLAVDGQPVAPPAQCVGEYSNGDVDYLVMPCEAGGLRLTVDSEPFADLTLYRGFRFAMRDCDTGEVDQAGRFVPDSAGRVAGLQVGGRLARKQLERVS
jgi:CubicO group peptidase (beta-lactamase class C family)